MLIISVEVDVCGAGLSDLNCAIAPDTERCTRFIVCMLFVVLAFETHRYNLVRIVLHFFAEEPEVLSDHLVRFTQHRVEWLLLTQLCSVQASCEAAVSQSKAAHGTVCHGCALKQVLARHELIAHLLSNAERLIQAHWKADARQVLADQAANNLPHDERFQRLLAW